MAPSCGFATSVFIPGTTILSRLVGTNGIYELVPPLLAHERNYNLSHLISFGSRSQDQVSYLLKTLWLLSCVRFAPLLLIWLSLSKRHRFDWTHFRFVYLLRAVQTAVCIATTKNRQALKLKAYGRSLSLGAGPG